MQTYQGGCLCSAIRYRISQTPIYSCICHCATCRRASGAPSVAWLTVNRSHFTVLVGSPHAYRSSQGIKRQFCRGCGSQLTYETATSPDIIDIATVSLDEPNAFPPTLEVWLEHRLPWQPASHGLVQFVRGTDHPAHLPPKS